MSEITMTLSNKHQSKTWELLEVPLTESTILKVTQVETRDGNVSTYFNGKKRKWEHKWAWLTADEYEQLRAFRDKQFEDFEYPLLSIPHLGVEQVPVYLELSNREIVRYDGLVQNAKILMRETRQG